MAEIDGTPKIDAATPRPYTCGIYDNFLASNCQDRRPTTSNFGLRRWDQFISLGPSRDQNPPFYGRIQWVKRRKDNRILVIYGAGDGNRTHVRSLGSLK